MTIIDKLNIQNVRNISEASLNFDDKFNLICGKNGSGKTSLLEALFLLACGRSFRSHLKSRIVSHGEKELIIFAELIGKYGKKRKIGLEKSLNHHARLKIDGESCKSLAEASGLLPVLLIDPNSYDLIEEGPKQRREYLNWGLFHVEQSFHSLWASFQRCLKQRNAVLKGKASQIECQTWDSELVQLVEQINQQRKIYFQELQPFFQQQLIRLDLPKKIEAEYLQGWSPELSFTEALKKSFFKDQILGYTTVGPQRADILFSIEGIPAQDVLSRGQAKLMVSALLFAQGEHYTEKKNNSCVYLIDDLASELDNDNRKKLFLLLRGLKGQFLVTGTNEDAFAAEIKSESKMFHVEQTKEGISSWRTADVSMQKDLCKEK